MMNPSLKLGSRFSKTFQDKSPYSCSALVSLLQGGTGGYDELLIKVDRIDRSYQELIALTRLYETVRFVGDESKERAVEITIATAEA